MQSRNKILWVTRAAVFIAFLVVMQAVTVPLGQIVTGSVVNFTLILSVMLGGLWTGVAVAALSPLFAFLVGVGPAMAPVLPFMVLGNLSLVLVWHLIAGRTKANRLLPRGVLALAAAAVTKCLVLYLGIVKLALPFVLNLPEKQAAVLSASFSLPQLATAAIGGALALAVLPALRKVIKK